MHLTYILNLSLTLVVFVQSLQEVCARPRVLWSKIWEEEEDEEWHKTETEAKIPSTYQKSYVLVLSCRLYICSNVCVLCIVQCAKQPHGTLVCGYYTCEYLRVCSRFSHSWRQLKKTQRWWEREKIDHKSINQTIADICKFIMDSYVKVGETFFNTESEMVTEEKYKKLKD